MQDPEHPPQDRKSDEPDRPLNDAENARYRVLFEQVPDGVLVIDGRGRIRAANLSAVSMFSGSASALIGNPITSLAASEPDRKEIQGEIERQAGERRGGRLQVFLRLSDGQPFPAEIRTSAIGAGEPAEFAWSVRDATDWQRSREGLEDRIAELTARLDETATRLVAADRAKDRFLSVLAHELRNPLGAILSSVEVLKLTAPGNPCRRLAEETIGRQVRHQARMLDSLLDASRVAEGRVQLHYQRIDMEELVRAAAREWTRSIQKAGLRLELETDGGPYWVDGDPARLTQVLGHLLDNSIKFTPKGGTITVALQPSEEGRRLAVTVRDTGSGIDHDLLPNIFDKFIQADRSLDRRQGGLGLGLSMVQGLVRLHGGVVKAWSAGPGMGAEFSFDLSLEEAPVRAAPARTAAAPARERSAPLRILVIDDVVDAADSLRDLLEIHGHEVKVAYSGNEGLETARRFNPGVVLCDLGLPGLDGYAVATELRRDGSTASTRLIAISGYGQEEDRRRAIESGFDLHLTKPVDYAKLESILRPD